MRPRRQKTGNPFQQQVLLYNPPGTKLRRNRFHQHPHAFLDLQYLRSLQLHLGC